MPWRVRAFRFREPLTLAAHTSVHSVRTGGDAILTAPRLDSPDLGTMGREQGDRMSRDPTISSIRLGF